MKIRLLLSVLILVYSCSESKPIGQANSSLPEDLVNHSLEFKKEIIDKKRINKILRIVKDKSIKKGVDPKITNRVWKNMIYAFIDYEFRNFKKKNK